MTKKDSRERMIVVLKEVESIRIVGYDSIEVTEETSSNRSSQLGISNYLVHNFCVTWQLHSGT
jgi:hypothetical protein